MNNLVKIGIKVLIVGVLTTAAAIVGSKSSDALIKKLDKTPGN